MNEKKMIPLFDPNDRGGNSRSHLNPRICVVNLGPGADIEMLSRILERSMTEGVMLNEPSFVNDARREQAHKFWEEHMKRRGVHLAECCVTQSRVAPGDMIVSKPVFERMLELNPGTFIIEAPITREDFGEHLAMRDHYIEPKQKKRGAFDRTGESPGATLDKKRKWWKR